MTEILRTQHFGRQVTEEARDNHKFLRTLERHLRAVATAPPAESAPVLGPMFNALRHVDVPPVDFADFFATSSSQSEDIKLTQSPCVLPERGEQW